MPAAGPELPPHLLDKRKRQQEEEAQDDNAARSGAKRHKSPPPVVSRQIGPTLPPAPIDEMPSGRPDGRDDSGSSDDDDDFGPSLPGQSGQTESPSRTQPRAAISDIPTSKPSESSGSKRDEWMMVPPKQDDLAARLDPSKQRARGFNTGKSARESGAGGLKHDTWTETPEQKRQRLANQVMGVKADSGKSRPSEAATRAKQAEEDQDKATRIKESRGKSLYDMHQARKDKVEDDDPSKRAFDREKDIGGGVLSGKQKRELLNKATDLGSKFSSAKYL